MCLKVEETTTGRIRRLNNLLTDISTEYVKRFDRVALSVGSRTFITDNGVTFSEDGRVKNIANDDLVAAISGVWSYSVSDSDLQFILTLG